MFYLLFSVTFLLLLLFFMIWEKVSFYSHYYGPKNPVCHHTVVFSPMWAHTHQNPVGWGVHASPFPPLATEPPESCSVNSSLLRLSHRLFLSPFAKTLVFVLQLTLSGLFQKWLVKSLLARSGHRERGLRSVNSLEGGGQMEQTTRCHVCSSSEKPTSMSDCSQHP